MEQVLRYKEDGGTREIKIAGETGGKYMVDSTY